MNTIRKIPMIEIQMVVVRRGREIMMKQHENEHQKIWSAIDFIYKRLIVIDTIVIHMIYFHIKKTILFIILHKLNKK